METIVEDSLREMAEFQAQLARRPVKGRYALATLGLRTECGGEVVSASTTMNCGGHRVACVGDAVSALACLRDDTYYAHSYQRKGRFYS